jgi:hypothetical protein
VSRTWEVLRLIVTATRGRIDLPLALVAGACRLPVERVRNAELRDVQAGPDRLHFRLVDRAAPSCSAEVDVLRTLPAEESASLRTLLAFLTPPFAVGRVEVRADHVAVFFRLRPFGLAVTLDALLALLRRARALPTGAFRAKGPTIARRATGSIRRGHAPDETTTR